MFWSVDDDFEAYHTRPYENDRHPCVLKNGLVESHHPLVFVCDGPLAGGPALGSSQYQNIPSDHQRLGRGHYMQEQANKQPIGGYSTYNGHFEEGK